jgi:hypothetical protein
MREIVSATSCQGLIPHRPQAAIKQIQTEVEQGQKCEARQQRKLGEQAKDLGIPPSRGEQQDPRVFDP